MLNVYTVQLYLKKKSPETDNESEKQLFLSSQKLITRICPHCTQDIQEPYVQCQPQNITTGNQKHHYYRIS
jgi:type II secretory ATPase GspE/PulE/Tfp pilus assembly ATPase PilB-like protein